jgi:hypothetical protein
VGTGLLQNPAYNSGKPWFITFRPLLHNTFRLTDEELEKYKDYSLEIEGLIEKAEALSKKGIDIYDIELELKLAQEKLNTGEMRMTETYIESVKARIKTMEEKASKKK